MSNVIDYSKVFEEPMRTMFEPQVLSMRLEKGIIHRLREKSVKDSVRTNSHVSVASLVIEALKKVYPELFAP
jgi:hypothetical protein